MKASDFNTSNYLNAKSAGEHNGKTLVIYDAKAETVQDKKKLVVEFENVDKTMVINKTNREILAEAFGDETDLWRGKRVVLGIVRVQFEGKLTPSILLTPVTTAQAPIIDADAATTKRLTPDQMKKAKK